MCQQCVDGVRQYWPTLPEEDFDTLLWQCTCYPAGGPEDVVPQLREMAEKSGCDFGKAMAIADAEIEAALKELRDREKP